MDDKKTGGQAYPAAWGNHEQGGDYVPGMTLRDWFAGQALAGMNAANRRWKNGKADMAVAAYS